VSNMSSRILRPTAGLEIRVLEWTPQLCALGDNVSSRANSEDAQSAPAPPSAADERLLRARIAELEDALRTGTRQAEERGFAAGRTAARQEFEARWKPVLDQLTTDLAGISEFRQNLLRESELDLANLAVTIARRILHREVTLDPSALNGLVSAALRKLRGQQIIRVRVHPQFETMLREALGPEYGDVEVVPETRAGSRALVFETERGNLDACVDSQLEEIQRGLVDGSSK
jgi:flagellar assembly protein FliH